MYFKKYEVVHKCKVTLLKMFVIKYSGYMLREWDPFLTKALKAITYIFWQKKKISFNMTVFNKGIIAFPGL